MIDKLTPKEALDYFGKRIKLGQCGNSTTQRKAFEAAIEALETQVPKKPARRTIYTEHWQGYYTIRVCPVCGIDTPVPRGLESWEFWCPDCGQALDWSEERGE